MLLEAAKMENASIQAELSRLRALVSEQGEEISRLQEWITEMRETDVRYCTKCNDGLSNLCDLCQDVMRSKREGSA